MSNRRKAGAKNRVMAYIAAAVVHLLLIGVLLFNFTNDEPREKVDAFAAEKVDTVKASVIDESQIKDQQEKIKKADAERERKKREQKKREQDELKKIKQQADQEKKKVADLQAKREAQKKKLEDERKAIALKKKKEEEKRKKEEEKRKKEADAEKKRLAELQKQVEQEEQDLRERQRINKLLAEEEAERRAKERTATVMSQYSAKIEQAIKDKWRVAPGTESWRVAKINIKLSPDGRVRKVVVINSSGSLEYDRSVETAVLQASPLPFPTLEEDQAAHEALQDININVKQ